MNALTTTAASDALQLTERFAELICADEQLLHAEFDAIVTAEWTQPPSRSGGHHDAAAPRRPGPDVLPPNRLPRRRRDLSRCR
ncbi:MAG TPA: hypothetical protein VFI30_05955 [Nocardioidaceae bacterium]|nr:hypothetical protein [Nocardioidaceae bacterium]